MHSHYSPHVCSGSEWLLLEGLRGEVVVASGTLVRVLQRQHLPTGAKVPGSSKVHQLHCLHLLAHLHHNVVGLGGGG